MTSTSLPSQPRTNPALNVVQFESRIAGSGQLHTCVELFGLLLRLGDYRGWLSKLQPAPKTCRSVRNLIVVPLLVSKRLHWVLPLRRGWRESRPLQIRQGQAEGSGDLNRRIVTLYFEEQRLGLAAKADCADDSNGSANESHPFHLTQNHSANLAGPRTNRHPQTDLSRPLRHRVGENSIESDRRDQRGDQCECCRQNAEQAIQSPYSSQTAVSSFASFLQAGSDQVD